jgi:hypothetical protein
MDAIDSSTRTVGAMCGYGSGSRRRVKLFANFAPPRRAEIGKPSPAHAGNPALKAWYASWASADFDDAYPTPARSTAIELAGERMSALAAARHALFSASVNRPFPRQASAS